MSDSTVLLLWLAALIFCVSGLWLEIERLFERSRRK